jgi:hypothetical protein
MPWIIALILLAGGAVVVADKAHDRTRPLPANFPADSDFVLFSKQNPEYGWLSPTSKDARDISHTGMFAVWPKSDITSLYWFNSKDGSAAGTSHYTGTAYNP